MLKITPSELMREVRAARAKSAKALRAFDAQRAARGGAYFMFDGEEARRGGRLNYYHRWTSYVVPQLAFNNPRAKVGTLLAEEQGEEAKIVELALNRWIIDNNFAKFLREGPANDMQYNFAVVLCSPEPIPGMRPIDGVGVDTTPGQGGSRGAMSPWSPRLYRMPQKRYFEDALAMTRDELRFRGHVFSRDLTDVEEEGEEGGWNVELAKQIVNAQLDALGRSSTAASAETIERGELVGVEVFVPEYELEEDNPWGVDASPGAEKGFHGTIFTLALASSGDITTEGEDEGEWLREPRPWYGPPEGPYVVFGVDTVPDETTFLGPLTAVESEIRELATDMDVATKMMRKYKRLILLAGAARPRDVKVIIDGQHDHVYKVSGITKDEVIPAEIGGLTDQVIAHVQFSKDSLESTLGLAELHSGNAEGIGTATEQALADSASKTRFAGIKLAFEDGVCQVLKRVAWWLWEDNRVAFPLGSDAAKQLGMKPALTITPDRRLKLVQPEPMFFGGRRGSKAPFEALSIYIEPFSMERVSEQMQQRRMMEALSLITSTLPLVAAYPDFPWQPFMQKMGDVMNLPELGQFFGDPAKIAEGAAAMAQAMGGGPKASSSGTPELVPGPRPGKGASTKGGTRSVKLPGNATGGARSADAKPAKKAG